MFTTKRYFCEHCKVPGHSVERCFKIHGYPPGFKQNPPRRYAAYASGEESTDVHQMEGVIETSSSNLAPHITLDQYNHLLSMINKQKDQDSSYSGAGSEIGCSGLFAGTHCLLSYTSTDDWILDSGASDYMCHDLTLFDTYSEILEENSYITIPDGSKIKVTHMGTVKINDYITLRNVLFVPTFKFNLIYVLKLCRDENCIVQFSSNGCTIQSQSMQVPQHFGNVQHGLYLAAGKINTDCSTLCSDSAEHFAHNVTSSKLEDAKLLHLRMGHVPFQQLNFIEDGMPGQELSDQFLCTVCPQARQQHLPFPNSEIRSAKCFELLHVDTWGPFQTATHDGCKLFLTIVDDFSRLTWIHMMHNKSDVVHILCAFVESIKTQFPAIVQKIRTDNEKSYAMDPYNFCISQKEYYIRPVVVTLHKKMVSWSASISI